MKTSTVDAAVARRFVEALFASAPAGSFVEVRFRRARGMGQSFHRVDALEQVAAEVMRRATTDVFVGVLPGRRRSGSRRDVLDAAGVVWVDCDAPDAVAALDAFRPAPSIVVASGARGHRHAYWLLRAPVVVQAIEQANRRLAWALGGDPRCSEPARILRPAGSLWHKAIPPAPVRLLHLDDEVRHDLDEIVGSLADPPGEPVAHRSSRGERRRGGDPLLDLAPAGYVERLTGQRVGRSRKVRCPFHEDQTPSLHVFAEPERGWYCFGCGRGGSIYDFAALLWQRGTRGEDFVEVRRELEASCHERPTSLDVGGRAEWDTCAVHVLVDEFVRTRPHLADPARAESQCQNATRDLIRALSAEGLSAVAVWVRGHQRELRDASPRAMEADRHMLARLPDGPFVDISRRQFDAKAAHPRYYWSESELASDWREIDDGPTNGRLEDEDWRDLA